MENRIIELVSSASCDVYPDNTLSTFTNLLPEQIHFEGQWEVALLEISYPTNYHNITDGRYTIEDTKADVRLFGRISAGIYHSVTEIIERIHENSVLLWHNKKEPFMIEWEILRESKKLLFRMQRGIRMKFTSDDISQVLGFTKDQWITNVVVSSYPINIPRIHSIMLYTDIVEYSIVGDVKVPLLRSFPFTAKFKQDIAPIQYMSYMSFDNLQFRRLLKNNFHSITIEARTVTGELIPFAAIGSTRVTLLFRKIS